MYPKGLTACVASFLRRAVLRAYDTVLPHRTKKRIQEIAWNQFGRFWTPSLIRRLKDESKGLDSVEKAVDFVLSFGYLGTTIAPLQKREEIVNLLQLMASLKSETVLEIGTANGGTLFLFTRVASDDALLLSMDLPKTPTEGGYPPRMVPVFESFATRGQKIDLILADSHKASTLDELRIRLKDRMIDVLFIDGDHSYAGVRKDFEMYSPLVREGGIIAFHDTVEHDPGSGCEVERFWKEIKGSYKHDEFTSQPELRWGGIGVLWK